MVWIRPEIYLKEENLTPPNKHDLNVTWIEMTKLQQT